MAKGRRRKEADQNASDEDSACSGISSNLRIVISKKPVGINPLAFIELAPITYEIQLPMKFSPVVWMKQ